MASDLPPSTGQPARRPHPDAVNWASRTRPRLDHLPRRRISSPAPGIPEGFALLRVGLELRSNSSRVLGRAIREVLLVDADLPGDNPRHPELVSGGFSTRACCSRSSPGAPARCPPLAHEAGVASDLPQRHPGRAAAEPSSRDEQRQPTVSVACERTGDEPPFRRATCEEASAAIAAPIRTASACSAQVRRGPRPSADAHAPFDRHASR